MQAKGLKSYVEWSLGGNPDDTSLRGEIECSYTDLIAVFGAPNGRPDGYKSDAEWVLTFTIFGTYKKVATIYNWKTGKNYLGEKGLPVEKIKDWHIGGAPEDGDVVGYVSSMLLAHYRSLLKPARFAIASSFAVH